jgi:hypothetical protein
MIAGHFGFAAIVKSRERQVPLWALMLATAWLDLVFVPLFLTGIERIHPVPGMHGGYGNGIIDADYSHSFVGMLAFSAILAMVFLPSWGKRTATVIGLVVASHWALDLLVHRADMLVFPANLGNFPRFGFGLWRFPMLVALLEALLVLLGAGFYWRAARAVSIQAKRGTLRAAAVSILIATFGLVILALDVSSR